MMSENIHNLLQKAGLRPTRQRLALGALLFSGEHMHITAEQLYERTRDCQLSVSLATVYNTLHQFTEAGLLKEVTVDKERTYFDTNTSSHFHFYCEETGSLTDVQKNLIDLKQLSGIPEDMEIAKIEVTVRLRPKKKA